MSHFLSRIFVALLLAAVTTLMARAAPPALELDADNGMVDAWPAVTVLTDPGGALTLAQVLDRRNEFVFPASPHANLGIHDDAVWLRVPLQVPVGGRSRWMLSVDYASIDQIELYLIAGAQSAHAIQLGRALPFSQRRWPSSVHAVQLDLLPGHAYELLLRVVTTSTMIVPLTLSSPEAFHAREVHEHLLQGLMAGAAICLLVYSLSQWVGLRDPMFLYYALTLAGTTLFFVAFFGLGPQHLWGDNAWLTTHASPLAVLIGGLLGGFMFIDRALAVKDIRPRISQALRIGAAMSALLGTLYAADIVDYRFAQVAATVLGPLPMVFAVPVAWKRSRAGERIGVYMLVGWSVYGVGTLTMAGLLRGIVAADYSTLHAFQFGAMFEMLMWMGVLSVRTETLRAAAQCAQLERDALHSLAHSDPLTSLPNRRGLNEALARILPACSAENLAAIYLLDLDGFKPVNDRLGHENGDEILIGAAHRLKASLRSSDVVARLGGDEFVVIAPGLSGEAEARVLGQKILDIFTIPFEVAGHQCRIGVTIGYALAPMDGRDAQGLLNCADAQMYAGKRAGRNRLQRTGIAGLLATD
jgi:diguanylate cyclase (GGDEF)-like protein